MGNAIIHNVISKKRTAVDFLFRQIASAKRGRFDTSSDKMLHDLPLDMLECILAKAVALEVKGMKLDKDVWVEKADLVINRMRSVCPYWNSILMTDFFQDELQRALYAQKTIGLEILHHSLIQCEVISVTTLKDEVLLFCLNLDQNNGFINEIRVYDRNNMMAEVKEVIPFTKIRPAYVAACNVSNCIYVLEQHNDFMWCSSVFRYTRDETHKWKTQPWLSDLDFAIFLMSVSANGNLIIRDRTIKIYGPNGFLQHEISGLGYVESIIERSNGNLVLTESDQHDTILTEMDTDGTIVQRYISLGGKSEVNLADISGRILINNPRNGIELLDSEFDFLDYTGPQPNKNGFNVLNSVHYNSERNEVASVYSTRDEPNTCALAIFRFTEE